MAGYNYQRDMNQRYSHHSSSPPQHRSSSNYYSENLDFRAEEVNRTSHYDNKMRHNTYDQYHHSGSHSRQQMSWDRPAQEPPVWEKRGDFSPQYSSQTSVHTRQMPASSQYQGHVRNVSPADYRDTYSRKRKYEDQWNQGGEQQETTQYGRNKYSRSEFEEHPFQNAMSNSREPQHNWEGHQNLSRGSGSNDDINERDDYDQEDDYEEQSGHWELEEPTYKKKTKREKRIERENKKKDVKKTNGPWPPPDAVSVYIVPADFPLSILTKEVKRKAAEDVMRVVRSQAKQPFKPKFYGSTVIKPGMLTIHCLNQKVADWMATIEKELFPSENIKLRVLLWRPLSLEYNLFFKDENINTFSKVKMRLAADNPQLNVEEWQVFNKHVVDGRLRIKYSIDYNSLLTLLEEAEQCNREGLFVKFKDEEIKLMPAAKPISKEELMKHYQGNIKSE